MPDNRRNRLRAAVCWAIAALAIPTVAGAREACTLLWDATARTEIHRSGPDCRTRFSPASTFKLPLALIGFESGLLQGPTAPAEPYDPALNAPFKVWRQTTTPQSWLRYSVVWYSQRLTRKAGLDAFQDFVDHLDYGNRDLSGDPGEDNGLTHAWLGSSLQISPDEQMQFLIRLLHRELALSDRSHDLLEQTIQRFQPQDMPGPVFGKTGTTWFRDADGHRTAAQLGWFVGWVETPSGPLAFVRLNIEDNPPKGFAGNRARDLVLGQIADWAGQNAEAN